MDLNKVIFTKEQVTELYGNHLVAAIGLETDIPVEKDAANIQFKGRNLKNIVWVIEEENQPFLTDADFQFLTKVLEACRLNLDDIALVNMSNAIDSFESVTDQLSPELVIASGISKDKTSITGPQYTIIQAASYRSFLTDSVEDMRNDAVKKSKLWVGLKELLSIN